MKNQPTGGTQYGLGILGNSTSNVVEKKAGSVGLEMLFKEAGKIAAAALFLEGVFWFLLHSLHVYYFGKDWEKS